MSKATNLSILALSLLSGFTGFANDGRDRHRGAVANQFVLFPEPISKANGYRFLDKDGPGGADGTEMFRWVRPIGATIVRLAAFETYKQVGDAPFPMAIFDLTSENGDTPVDFSAGKPPRGRHPGGAHDGGLNMDLGYYLTSDKGKVFQPDLAACTEHFKKPKELSKAPLEDASQCMDTADKVSIKHESLFLLELAKLNREFFDSDLIEEIGIDWEVRKLVLKQLETWSKTNSYGATNELTNTLSHAFTSDVWDGWSTSHHHHVHVRMRELNMMGRFRQAFDRLVAREKQNDLALMKDKNPASAEHLWVRLYSSNLSNALEAEVLGANPNNDARFTSDALAAQNSDPSRFPKVSASWDLDDELRTAASKAEVKVEILSAGKVQKTLSKSQNLPERPAYLNIAVEANQIHGVIENDALGKSMSIKLAMPQPYLNYITSASYFVSYGDNAEPRKVLATGPDFIASIGIEKNKPISHINAQLVLSGRMILNIPVFSSPLWAPVVK